MIWEIRRSDIPENGPSAPIFLKATAKQFEAQVREEGGRWEDFVHFEGNSNAFRLLTHQFIGRRKGGFAMTYSTLASIVKYPYASYMHTTAISSASFSLKRNRSCASQELGICRSKADANKFARYPLVYLVEAADDICYQIMDIEDACKLHIILTLEEAQQLMLNFFPEDRLDHIHGIFKMVSDGNEQLAYLRSGVIGVLVEACSQTFIDNEQKMLEGDYTGTLIHDMDSRVRDAYESCSAVAYKKIYKAKEVLDIELAGYHIFSHLIDSLTEAVTNPEHSTVSCC